MILLFWTIFFFKENCSTYKIIYEKLFYMNEHLYATWLTSSLKRCFLRMWDYKAGIGQEGVTSRTKPDVRMVETRDRSNFFDDSVRKRQKRRKKRERKKSSKMRGEKSDPLTMRLVVVKKKRKKREDRKL